MPSLTIPAPLNDPVTRVNAKLAVPETTTTLPPVPRRMVRFVKLAVAPPPTSNAGACAPVASMIVCRALVPMMFSSELIGMASTDKVTVGTAITMVSAIPFAFASFTAPRR